MTPMLSMQRAAYALMPRWWKPAHRLLWRMRTAGLFPNVAWRWYVRRWPKPTYVVGEKGPEKIRLTRGGHFYPNGQKIDGTRISIRYGPDE